MYFFFVYVRKNKKTDLNFAFNLRMSSKNSHYSFEGFERLSSLKLETLNISANEFNKTIMKSLGAITSIKTLALSKINLDGSYHIQGMWFDCIIPARSNYILKLSRLVHFCFH